MVPAVAQSVKEKRREQRVAFKRTHRIVLSRLKPDTTVMVLYPRRNSKSEPVYVGPYTVIEALDSGGYRLRSGVGDEIIRALPHIKVFRPNSEHSDNTAPSIVERIIRHRGSGPGTAYLTKFAGEPHSQNEWLRADRFDDTSVIDAYWRERARRQAPAQPERRSTRRRKPKKHVSVSA